MDFIVWIIVTSHDYTLLEKQQQLLSYNLKGLHTWFALAVSLWREQHHRTKQCCYSWFYTPTAALKLQIIWTLTYSVEMGKICGGRRSWKDEQRRKVFPLQLSFLSQADSVVAQGTGFNAKKIILLAECCLPASDMPLPTSRQNSNYTKKEVTSHYDYHTRLPLTFQNAPNEIPAVGYVAKDGLEMTHTSRGWRERQKKYWRNIFFMHTNSLRSFLSPLYD